MLHSHVSEKGQKFQNHSLPKVFNSIIVKLHSLVWKKGLIQQSQPKTTTCSCIAGISAKVAKELRRIADNTDLYKT